MILVTIVYALVFGTLFFGLEIIKRKKFISADETRRIAHLGSALIAFTFPIYLPSYYIIFLCGFFFILLAISKRRMILGSIHGVTRITWGELFFPIGVALLAIICLPEQKTIFQVAVLVLGISDTLASVVGSYYPRTIFYIFKNKKTVTGSLAFFISAFAVLILYGIKLPEALLFAALAAVVEVISPYGSDNVTVPLAVACLLLFNS